MRTLQFLRTLGAGAFGTVYLAEFSSGQGFRRQVAVKVIQRNQTDNEMFLARIRDEARLLGLLQDDAILKVLDMVQLDGMDAVIMEYVEGLDLDSLAREGRAPPPRALAELAAAVGGALSRAHSAKHPASGIPLNVVHRDVKPANIMVTSSGGVKLLDFGVARARFDARESQTGQFMLGTLNYMAPEYIVTGEISPAADIYGLALAVWEVAAGELYGQPKIRQDAHERRVAERLAQIASTHGELNTVLARMLAWSPAERPSASEVERLFLAAADELRGQGLRIWATNHVAEGLRNRPAAADKAGLLGRNFPLLGASMADTPTPKPAAHAVSAPDQPPAPSVPTRAPAPTPPALPQRTAPAVAAPRAAAPRSSAPPPSRAPVAPRPAPKSVTPAPRTASPSVASVLIQAAAIGAVGGIIALGVLVWLLRNS